MTKREQPRNESRGTFTRSVSRQERAITRREFDAIDDVRRAHLRPDPSDESGGQDLEASLAEAYDAALSRTSLVVDKTDYAMAPKGWSEERTRKYLEGFEFIGLKMKGEKDE